LARFCANSWSAARKATLFAPTRLPFWKNPSDQLEPHVVLHLRVHLEREVAHHQQVALLRHRDQRRGGHRPIGRDDEVDLVHVEQLGVDARDVRRVGLVVVGDELDLAVEQPALCVDIVDPQAQRDQRRLAAGAERPGLRHAHADLHGRFLRERASRNARSDGERRPGLQYIASGMLHDFLLLVPVIVIKAVHFAP